MRGLKTSFGERAGYIESIGVSFCSSSLLKKQLPFLFFLEQFPSRETTLKTDHFIHPPWVPVAEVAVLFFTWLAIVVFSRSEEGADENTFAPPEDERKHWRKTQPF